jgi:hypothetical protein
MFRKDAVPPSPNIVDPWLLESTDTEVLDVEADYIQP